MKLRWQRLLLAIAYLTIVCGSVRAATAEDSLRDQVFQLVAQHRDREAARLLIDAWQAGVSTGSVSPGCVALNEALEGHYLTARPLMDRDVAGHPADPTRPAGALLLVLLEGNPMACRQAIETMLRQYPRDANLRARDGDVLESLGISGPVPSFPDPAPAPLQATEPPRSLVAPLVEVLPTPRVEAELKPVQGETERQRLLRQLAEAQARHDPTPAAPLLVARAHHKELDDKAKAPSKQQHDRNQVRLLEQRRRVERAKADQAKLKAAEEKRLAAKGAKLQAAVIKHLSAAPKKERAEPQRRLPPRHQTAAASQAFAVEPPRVPPQAPTAPPKREVWVAERRAEVRAHLGRPKSSDRTTDWFAGLTIWYDSLTTRVTGFKDESAWYAGVHGARPGMTLRDVLRCLPSSDGIFHFHPRDPGATESLYVLSTVDGAFVELQQAGDQWLSTFVQATTPTGVADFYQQLTQQPGSLRRLAPDYVFALEARHRPLP